MPQFRSPTYQTLLHPTVRLCWLPHCACDPVGRYAADVFDSSAAVSPAAPRPLARLKASAYIS